MGDSGESNNRSSSSEMRQRSCAVASDGPSPQTVSLRDVCARARWTTLLSFAASTISWNPPRPLSAMIFPARESTAWQSASSLDAILRPITAAVGRNTDTHSVARENVGPAGRDTPVRNRHTSEFFHRCVGTIIGQRFDNGETWTAIGAVREGITKATIIGIENLADTVGTGSDVRQNQRRLRAACCALANLEPAVINRIEEGRFEALNDGARWFFFFQTHQKPI